MGIVSSSCCNGALGAVDLFLNSAFVAEAVTVLWAAEHNEAEDDNPAPVDPEEQVVD